MKNTVIIVAGGQGKRMGTAVAKQYIELRGRTILSYTIEAFEMSKYIDNIIVVTRASDIAYINEDIIKKHGFTKVSKVIAGGSQRQDSVYNGLKEVPEDTEVVFIHDGVRPFIKESFIKELSVATIKYKAALLAVAVKDTIKVCNNDGFIVDTPDRDTLYSAQTPQCFRYDIIMDAYKRASIEGYYGTDDATLVARYGTDVKVIIGDYDNIKITTPEDLHFGEMILQKGNK